MAGGSGSRRVRARPVTLLPLPLSPTMASVSPWAMEKEMPLTASIFPVSVAKSMARFLMSRKGWSGMASDGFRVEGATQGVAENIERKDEAEERARGGGDIPPNQRVAAQFGASGIDHDAPARRADGSADAEVTEDR